MARNFVPASSQYASNANAILTAAPITMACWFYSISNSLRQTLMSIGISGSADQRFTLLAEGSVLGDPIRAQARTSSNGSADSTTGYTVNTWQHACGVFASATDRRAYVNGGSEGTNATSLTPAGVNNFLVGAQQSASPANIMSGRIAEVGIWDVALSTSEIAALGAGVSPLRIRPGNLKAYWPLFGVGSPEPDYSNGGFHLTLNASPTQADHAPVMPPFFTADWFGAFTAAAAAAGHSLILGDNLSNRIFGGLVVR